MNHARLQISSLNASATMRTNEGAVSTTATAATRLQGKNIGRFAGTCQDPSIGDAALPFNAGTS